MNAELQLDEPGKVTAKILAEKIATTFSRPSWATLFNVRNAAGFDADRTADALAMGIWPSTGLVLHGFEIKVSRSDWQRELKDPWKSEAFAKFCDRWSLVIAKADMVKPGELPDGWGLFVPHARGLKCLSPPKDRTPEPIDRSLLAAMLKRATDADPEEIIAAREAGKKESEDGMAWTAKRAMEERDELQKVVADFEAASGIRLNQYTGGTELGKAVQFVRDGGVERQRRQLEWLAEQAAKINEQATAALVGLPVR